MVPTVTSRSDRQSSIRAVLLQLRQDTIGALVDGQAVGVDPHPDTGCVQPVSLGRRLVGDPEKVFR